MLCLSPINLSACLQTFLKINGSVLWLSCCYCTTWWTESTGKQQVATWLHYWLFDPENKIMAQRLLVCRQPLCRAPNEANAERHQRLPVQKSIVKVHFELLAHLWWLMTHCLGWLWAGKSQRNPQWRSQCPRTPFHQPKTQTTVPVFWCHFLKTEEQPRLSVMKKKYFKVIFSYYRGGKKPHILQWQKKEPKKAMIRLVCFLKYFLFRIKSYYYKICLS